MHLYRLSLSETIPAQGVGAIRPRGQLVKLRRSRTAALHTHMRLGVSVQDAGDPVTDEAMLRELRKRIGAGPEPTRPESELLGVRRDRGGVPLLAYRIVRDLRRARRSLPSIRVATLVAENRSRGRREKLIDSLLDLGLSTYRTEMRLGQRAQTRPTR